MDGKTPVALIWTAVQAGHLLGCTAMWNELSHALRALIRDRSLTIPAIISWR